MSAGMLREKIRSRVIFDKDEGDIAYYYALMFEIEYITKLIVSGVIACLGDDADHNRYSLEYNLVRADSIGEWVRCLQSALTGRAAQFFFPQTTHLSRDLTERVSEGDWRFTVVRLIYSVAQRLDLEMAIGDKVALRQFFDCAVAIRNRTRGHGAITSKKCNETSPLLDEANNLIWDKLLIFNHDWAHLHRNLNGKYRVSPLLGDCVAFDYLKRSKDVTLTNGVYINVGELLHVPLLFSEPGVDDIFVPNGQFKSDEFEVLSLVTDETARRSGTAWSTPLGRLPASHTEGYYTLDILGNTFTNLPELAQGHVIRLTLENSLRMELLNLDRHPIITLTGLGGIGKTTLTLAVVEKLAKSLESPYEVVLWMSSRDLDLLDTGPKPVNPKVVTREDLAKSAVELLAPQERNEKGFNPQKYLERCLSEGATGKTLFIFDNFETVEDPVEVFRWIDTHIRHPNKVLITTRFREFRGDYPIEITGMTYPEARQLVSQEVKRLGISDLVSEDYTRKLFDESDGHPYVIKIMLGQVAKERRAVKPERIMAGADQLMLALFERTFAGLSPAGQRIFLLLSSWRVFVPSIAVEAVLLRPENERSKVSSAIDELRRYSLIEEIVNEEEDHVFIGVPLVAANFGCQKLKASQFKVAIELDCKILREFGVGDRNSSRQGVMPRIDKFIAAVASRASENPEALKDYLPILEYIANHIPRVFFKIATLLSELPGKPENERIQNYLRRYLESSDSSLQEKAWYWLAEIFHKKNDPLSEIHALSEVALLPNPTPKGLGAVANRINRNLRELKAQGIAKSWSDEIQQLIERVAEKMECYLVDFDATDCSRLAWLFLNIGNSASAYEIAKRGISKDVRNEYCIRLMERLEG